MRGADRAGARAGDRLIRRLLLGVTLTAAPLLGQERPPLARGQDPNDWASYYERGTRELDRPPGVAETYFAYAARLDPSVAEPLLGRYAAWWRFRPWLRNYLWQEKPSNTDSTRLTEDWLAEADLRNPFVHQGLLLWTLPKHWVIRTDDAFGQGLRAFFHGDWEESVHDLTAAIARDSTRWAA